MNKIFKVVWSKTKRCYVVTSELAKNHTKSNQVKSEAASKRGWLSVFGGVDWSSATARAVMAALVVTGALGLSTGVSAADVKVSNGSVATGTTDSGGTTTLDATGSNSVALNPKAGGSTSQNVANDSVAIGTGASTDGASTGAVAIGKGATATNSKEAIVFGPGTNVSTSQNAIVFGKGWRITNDPNAIIMGFNNKGSNSISDVGGSVILGYNVTSSNATDTVTIGTNANTVNAAKSVAIGYNATANTARAIAIGTDVSIDSSVPSFYYTPTNTIAIGQGIKLSGYVQGSVVIGGLAEKSNTVFTSVEHNGKSHAGYSVAIGAGARVANYLLGSNAKYANGNSIGGDGGGVAVGPRVWATGQATAMGNDTYALGGSSIAIGSDDNPSVYDSRISAYDGTHYYYQLYRNMIDQAVSNNVNMHSKSNNIGGFYLDANNNMVRAEGANPDRARYSPTMARGVGSIAIGSRSIAYADGSNAFGTVAQALADGATAFGTKTRAEGKSSMSMGNNSQVFANNAIVAGSDSQVFSQGGNAYGYRVYASGQNSLAIGSDAYANASMVFLSDSTGKPVFSKDGAYNEDPAKAATSILSNNTDVTSKFDSLLANNSKKSLQSTATAKDSVSNTDAGLKYAHVNVATRYHGLENVVARQAGSEDVSINDLLFSDKKGEVPTDDLGQAITIKDAPYDASLYKNNAIAIGSSAIAQGDNGVSLGHGAIGLGDNSMAIGTYSMTTGNNSVAFGLASRAAGDNTLAVGTAAASMGKNALAVGIGAINYGDNSTVMGYTTGIGEGSKNSITIGAETMIGSGITDSLVIGTGSSIGKYAVLSGDSKGNTSGVNGIYAVDTKTGKVMTDGNALSSLKGLEAENISGAMAIGVDSRVYSRYGGKKTINGEDGTPVEVEINPGETGNNAMAIGNNAQAWLDNSLALGNESKTDYTLEWLNAPAYVTPNAVAVSTDGRTGVISVGSIGNERRIVNVAAGSRDTDAVNVSQLKQMWGTVQRELDPTDRNKSVHFLATNYHPTSEGNNSPDYSSLYSKQVAYQRYVKYATEYKSYLVQEAYGGPGLTEGARASYTKELSDLKQELSDLGYDVAETAIDKFDVSGITNLNTMSDEDKQAAKQAFKTAHGDNPEEVLKGLIKLSEEDTKKLDNGEILKTGSMQTVLTPDTLVEKLTLINHDNTQGLTNGSIAVGYNARVGMKDDTDVVSGQEGGIAIGHMARNYATKNVNVKGYSAGSIALGDKSLVLESDLGTKDANTDTINVQPGVYYKTTSDFDKASVIASPNAGVVSVGASADKSEDWGGEWKQSTRRIINVAAGANDTDAVNVSQLKSLATQTITLVANGKTTGSAATKTDTTTAAFAIGGDENGNGTTFKLLGENDGFDITTTASKTENEGNTVKFALNKATEVAAGNNHVVTSDAVYKAIENVNTDVTNLTNGVAGNMVYTDKDGNRVVKDGDKFYTSSSLDEAKKANDGTYYNTTTLENNGFTIDGKGVIVNKDGSPIDTTKEGVAEALDKAKADAAVKQVANGDIVISAVNADGSTTSPTTISNVQSNLASATKNLSADATDDEKKAEADRVAEIATKAMTGDSDATDALGKSGLINATGDVLNNAATLGDLQTVAQAGLTFQTNNLAEEGNNAGKVQTIHKTLGETLNIEGKKDATFDGEKYSADNLVTTVDTVINADKTTSQVIRIAMKNTPNLEGVNVQNVTYKDGEKVVNGGVTITATPEKGEDGQSSATNGMTINLAGNDGKGGPSGQDGDGNVRISGVADGKADNDAVNVSQLKDLRNEIGVDNAKSDGTGAAGKDGLDGKDMGSQITAIRDGEAGPMVYTDKEGNRVVKDGENFYTKDSIVGAEKAADGTYYNTEKLTEAGAKIENGKVVGTDGNEITDQTILDKVNAAKVEPKSVDSNNVQISAVDPKTGEPKTPTTIGNVQSTLVATNPEAIKDPQKTAGDIASTAMTGDKTAKEGTIANTGLLNAEGSVLNNAATIRDLQTVANAGLTFQTNNLAEEGNNAGKVQTIHKALGETLNIEGKKDATFDGTKYSVDNLVTTNDNGTIRIAMLKQPTLEGLTLIKETKITEGGTETTVTNTVNLVPEKATDGTTTLTLDNGTKGEDGKNGNVRISGVADGKADNDAVNVSQLNDLKTIINGNPGTEAPKGEAGPSGKDGLNGQNMGAQITAIREGTAGTMVYTVTNSDGKQERVTAEGNQYYKNSDLNLTDYTKAVDGKWYKVSEVDPKTGLPNDNAEAVDFAKDVVKSDDKGNKLSPVDAKDIHISAVNAAGDVTGPTTISNVQSNLASATKHLKDNATDDEKKAETERVAVIATKAMTGNPDAADALGKSSLINATGDVLNNAATLGDLQTVAQAGLTFQTNNLAEEGNDAGKVQTIHKTLGETLSIIGDENAKYLTKEDVTAPGTTTEGDTSSTTNTPQPKPPAITYSSDNLVTTKTTNGAIQIAMKDVPNFDGIHVGKATFTFAPSGNDNKDLRFTVIPDDKNVYGAVVDGIRTGDNYTSAVNKGYVDAKINGTAAINAFQPTLQSRPESADGWNDSGVGIQIQALRNGVAGPVVYTDASGNRAIMVTDAADPNNPKAQKIVKLDSLNGYKLALDKSGNPVGWYKADADIWEKERVEATGEYVDTNRISTEAKPEVVAEAVKKFAEDEYVKDKVVLSLVQTNGATDGSKAAKIVLRNLASDITFTPSTETDEAKKELADAKALTKALVDTETDSNTLTSAATLQDLRAVAKAGLTFETNDGVDKSIHKTLGETLNIEGQKGAKFDGEKYSADNLVTTNDEGIIRIAMLKQPTLEGLKLETKETKTNEDGTSTDVTHTVIMTPTTDGGTTALTLNNGKTSTDGSPVDTRVKISNVANGTAPNDAVNYSQLENLDNQVKELQNGENGPMVYTDGEGNRVVKDGDNFYKASDLVTKDGTHYDVSNLPEGAKLSEDGSAIVNSNGEPISQEDLTKAKDAARVDSSKIQVSAVDPKTGEPAAPTTIGNVKSNYGYNGIGTEADGKTPAKGIVNAITPKDAKTAMNGAKDTDGTVTGGLLNAKGADLNKVATVGDLQAAAQAGLDFTGNSYTTTHDDEKNQDVKTLDTAHTTLGGTIAIEGGTEYNANDFSDKNISTKVDPKTKTISINIKKNPEFDSVILGQPGENGQPDKQVTISTANGNEVNFTSTHPQDGDTNVILSGIKDDPTRRDTAITRGALEDLGILKGEVGPRHIAGSDVGGNLSNGDNLNDYSLNKQVQAQREGLSGNVVYTDAKGNRLVKAGNRFYSAAPLNKYILESKLRQDPLTGMWFNISDFDEDNKVKEDAKGKGLTAEQLAKKAGVSETQVSDIKLSAVNMSGDTNTPTEIGNIKSTIGLNKEAKVDASGEAVYVGGPIKADAAKKAVVVTDDKGNVTGGLLNVSGSQLNTVATVGDLQAVAQAGLDITANTNTENTNADPAKGEVSSKTPMHRTLGSQFAIKGSDNNDNSDFKTNFSTENIMTQVQGNVIRIGMKSAPEFTGVNIINANQPTLRLENKDGHLMLTEVKGDVVQSSVRLATQNDGFYIKDANGNKTLVHINNEDAIEFNKYLTVTKADPKSDDASATGNTGTTGSTGSGTITGENVDAGTTTGGNTTGSSTSDTTPKAVGTVDVVVKDTPTDDGDIANKKYVDTQIGDIINNFNTKNELEGQGTIATNTSTDKLAVSGVTVKQYLDDNYMTRPEINRRFTEVSKQANAGTAAAMAAAGIPQVTNMYDDNLMIGAGVGSYGGESAVAIGVSGTNDDRDITYKVAATYDSRGKWGLSGGIGFSVGSGRDNPTKPERKTISERVDRLTAENKQLNDRNSQLEAQMKALSDKNDRLEKEMQEMKAMFRQMMPQMQKANGQAASNEDGTKEEQKITATA